MQYHQLPASASGSRFQVIKTQGTANMSSDDISRVLPKIPHTNKTYRASHLIVTRTGWRTELRGTSQSSARGNAKSHVWRGTSPCTSWRLTG